MGVQGMVTVRRSGAVLVTACSLALIACSDGGDEAAPSTTAEDAETGDGGGSGSELESETQESLSSLNSEIRGDDTVFTLPEEVLFEFGESTLLPDAAETLDAVAEAIGSTDGAPVQVVGHTDDVGSNADNHALSEARAQAVVGHLTGAGVDSGQITAEGRGESEPVAPNDSDDSRAQNRCVEIVVEGVDLTQVTS